MSTRNKIDPSIIVAVIGLIGVIITAIIAPIIVPPLTVWLQSILAPTTVAIATTTTPSATPPSPVPSLTATPTKRPPTRTATPPPTTATPCSIPLGSHLQDAEPKIASSGCPKSMEQPVANYAIQQFEHGWMFEPFLERHTVYVLFDLPKKTWKQFQENWESGDRPDSCPAIQVPPGNYGKPQYGFGQVWCGVSADGGLSPDERHALGYSIHAAFGPTPTTPVLYYQEFVANGILFGGAPLPDQYVSEISGTVIFILSRDGSWDMVGRR